MIDRLQIECGRSLVIGAHPDDIELGCGGTLAKLSKKMWAITALVLTKGEVLSSNGGRDRVEESRKALSLLGVSDIRFSDFSDTKVYEDLKEVIEIVQTLVTQFSPQRIYVPSRDDNHQDHWAAYQAAMAAANKSVPQVLGYETPSTAASFRPSLFEDIGDTLQTKLKAVEMHKTQSYKEYMSEDMVIVRARFRGSQAGVPEAEAFEVYKYVL